MESGVACDSTRKGLTRRGSLHRGREPGGSLKKPISMQSVLLKQREAQRDPHHWLDVHRPSSASPETSALYGQRSPEEERKQDTYQERLFLFFVTDPHLGLGRAVCRAGLAAAAYNPQSGSH